MNIVNFDLTSAIISLYPTSQWTMVNEDYDKLTWLDDETKKPSLRQLTDEVARLKAEYDAKEYQRLRAAEYPPLADQLDMQYHDAVNGTTTWQDAINAVKAKYPKPEGV